MRAFPVAGATLFLSPGDPAWRIGKLDANTIHWNALPVEGLPEIRAWNVLSGRYPDNMWVGVDRELLSPALVTRRVSP